MLNRIPRQVFIALTLAAAASCSSSPEDDATSGDNALSAYDNNAACSSDSPSKGRCLSEATVAQLLRTAGFPETIVPQMVCTAKWESGFYERASHTNTGGSVDRGIFQINSVHLAEKGCPSNAEGFFDATNNAKCALVVYNGQQRGAADPLAGVSKAWAAYRAHTPECKSYHLAANAAAPLQAANANDAGAGDAGAGGGIDDVDPGDDDDANLPTPPVPPSGGTSGAGSCFAGTLQMTLPEGGCYQRQSDSVWFQCKSALWYRGVSDDGTTGPFGACVPSYPLGSQ